MKGLSGELEGVEGFVDNGAVVRTQQDRGEGESTKLSPARAGSECFYKWTLRM